MRVIFIIIIITLLITAGYLSFLYEITTSEIEMTLNRPSYSPDGKYILLGINGNIFLIDRIIKNLTHEGEAHPSYLKHCKKIVCLKVPDSDKVDP